jgi:TRAP-type C4-dicarboxylate transport system permease small subunit
VAAGVAGAIMVAITFDVAYRKAGRGDIPGLLELVETFMILVVYLGLAHAERTNTHVRVSLVTSTLPSAVRNVVRTVALIIGMGGAAWFSWATLQRAETSFTTHEIRTGLLNFPLWPARFAIVLGFTLLMLENAVKLYEHVTGSNGEPDAAAPSAMGIDELADVSGERSE